MDKKEILERAGSSEIKEQMERNFLRKFEKTVYPNEEYSEKLGPQIIENGDKIIEFLKEKELTYVDSYVTLEYVYRKLKFMSEYTHL
ncbi:hypothetical protein PMY38_16815 [Clostridium tertium]|uniref:hypothetical protein n=1 Tax=Clostridium tertium TaxID=1559 RepID=UPI00232DBD7E|nr:hypothetical protein [Clostridium tertium]MDB1956570.1 hypothetical protein [Clostridium tertium]MDB1960263.1 hypothetical protein [Clostridium tertium]MDB1964074.1 hypothetical protein [Clostridium tertium]MDB1967506.1 hypothetical protein [Clostridium tertium]